MTMITREQWIDRLATCREEDLEYLTSLFQDWRQEELEEEPTPLVFELDYSPYLWYTEGSNVVAHNPIRKLLLDRIIHFISIEKEGYLYFHFSTLANDYDKEVQRKATEAWFPSADIIHEPDNSYKALRYYKYETAVPAEIIQTACTNALKWARKRSKRMKNKNPINPLAHPVLL